MTSAQHKTLRGWKEIATHVGRDVRTVQRWERQRGFPVRRLPGAERGNVFALAAELDHWLHPPEVSASAAMEAAPVAPERIAENSAAEILPEAPAAETPVAEAADAGTHPAVRLLAASVWRFAAVSTLVAAAVALFFSQFHGQSTPAQPGTFRVATTPAPYVSRIAGVDALYLQGMYLFGKRTPESLLAAKKLLLEATARDPRNMQAWSGLAQTLTLLVAYGAEQGTNDRLDARAAAERALALEPELAEPHAVLGFSDFFWTGDVRGAEPHFRRALQINPASALAHSWYGTVLTYEARYSEALEHLNEAQRLEPASTAILANRALALGLTGHREEAVRMLQQAQEENPIPIVRFALATLSLVRPRNPDIFLRQEMELSAISHSDGAYQAYAAALEAYRRGGEAAMWRSLIADGDRGRVGLDLLAGAHAALGEYDAAFGTLAEAQRRSMPLTYLPIDPRLLPLHGDPRFNLILGSQGLPPVS